MKDHLNTTGHLLLEVRGKAKWAVIAGAELDGSANGRSMQMGALAELMVRMAERSHVSPEPTAYRITHYQPPTDRPATETVLLWAGQTAAPPELAKRIQAGADA